MTQRKKKKEETTEYEQCRAAASAGELARMLLPGLGAGPQGMDVHRALATAFLNGMLFERRRTLKGEKADMRDPAYPTLRAVNNLMQGRATDDDRRLLAAATEKPDADDDP